MGRNIEIRYCIEEFQRISCDSHFTDYHLLGARLKEITFYLEAGTSPEGDWRQSANCRNVKDPDLFFPIGTTGPALEQIELAKSICRRCPVRSKCLEWAMQTHQDCGVWGGLSEDERKALARRRREGSEVLTDLVGRTAI